MTMSSVGTEEVRAAVNVALDELRESLRKVNHEVGTGERLLHSYSRIASIKKIAYARSSWRKI